MSDGVDERRARMSDTDGGYEILSVDELERCAVSSGAPIMLPLRRRLGYRASGVNAWTAEVGAHVIERHAERDGDEELYVVVRGRARFTVADDVAEATPGTLVHVPPGTLREAEALEPDTIVLAIGAKAGEAFVPKPWEDFQVAFAKRRAGEADDARALIAAALERHPGTWQGPYNAACFEALEGNVDAAFDHLRVAAQRAPNEVGNLADDEDLASLRGDPRWQELFRA
jgi:quercetin dioxygenase-like cupin family protein